MEMTDYISREDAVEAVEGWGPNDLTEAILADIKTIPAADVRPVVKAVWEDAPNPQWPAYDIRHCSCCGWNIPKSKLRAKDLSWHFCPNCGADMREES